METIQSEWVEVMVQGQTMEAYWARPKGDGPYPGVVVLMEIFGVNAHIRSVAERLASDGYGALAINFYHRTTPNLELGYSEEDVVLGRVHKDQTTREGLLADVEAAVAFLNAQPEIGPKNRMGSIGFCFGGHVAYLTAVLPSIQAAVVFYGAGITLLSPGSTPGTAPPTVAHTPEIKGKVLCLFGDQDPMIPMIQTVEIEKALRQSEIPHEVVRYAEAGHGFFCNQRQDYRPHEAEDAWQRVKALFSTTLSS